MRNATPYNRFSDALDHHKIQSNELMQKSIAIIEKEVRYFENSRQTCQEAESSADTG